MKVFNIADNGLLEIDEGVQLGFMSVLSKNKKRKHLLVVIALIINGIQLGSMSMYFGSTCS